MDQPQNKRMLRLLALLSGNIEYTVDVSPFAMVDAMTLLQHDIANTD